MACTNAQFFNSGLSSKLKRKGPFTNQTFLLSEFEPTLKFKLQNKLNYKFQKNKQRKRNLGKRKEK